MCHYTWFSIGPLSHFLAPEHSQCKETEVIFPAAKLRYHKFKQKC